MPKISPLGQNLWPTGRGQTQNSQKWSKNSRKQVNSQNSKKQKHEFRVVHLRILHTKIQPPKPKTVAYRLRTDGQTDRQTEKVNTEDPFFSKKHFLIFDFLSKERSDKKQDQVTFSMSFCFHYLCLFGFFFVCQFVCIQSTGHSFCMRIFCYTSSKLFFLKFSFLTYLCLFLDIFQFFATYSQFIFKEFLPQGHFQIVWSVLIYILCVRKKYFLSLTIVI